jgi:ribonuclease III
MSFFSRLFRKRLFSVEETRLLAELEDKVEYTFRDLGLLKKALSHKSYTNERRMSTLHHNERLEFLGDAVLELGVSDLLIHYFPESHEGEMSKIRASLVNETALAEQARKIDLGKYIYLGKGEDQCSGREKNSLLSDAFEALLGAIYLDGGFQKGAALVKRLFQPEISRAGTEDISRDYKTKLQEEVQTRFKEAPEYRLVSETGPDHAKVFEIHLYVKGEKVSLGTGKSKKQAEQSAAQAALNAILSNDS